MDYSTLNNAFQVELDIVSNSTAPGLTDDEVDHFLNKGQDLLVDELYKKYGTKYLKELLADIKGVISANYAVDSVNIIANAKQLAAASLTTNYMYFASCVVLLSRSTRPAITTKWIPCMYMEKEDAFKFSNNTYNVPDFVHPRVFLDDEKIVVIYDNYTTLSAADPALVFEYISIPARIANGTSTTSELNSNLHKDVVTKGVDVALKTFDIQKAAASVQLNEVL